MQRAARDGSVSSKRETTMADEGKTADDIARAGEHLFQYAIDRADMAAILNALPLAAPEKRAALEYEIQLLRIICMK